MLLPLFRVFPASLPRLTITKVDNEASEIWKFQRYALIIDFEERLNLPPPFIIISYICILLKKIYNKMKGCKRNCCTFCCCSKKAKVCGLISLSMYSCIYSFSHVVNLCFMSRRSFDKIWLCNSMV